MKLRFRRRRKRSGVAFAPTRPPPATQEKAIAETKAIEEQ